MQNRILRTASYVIVALGVLRTDPVAHAQTYKYSTLYSVRNTLTDPRFLESSLIVDSAGNLYGTSAAGGRNHSFCNLGCGTVYKVTQSGVVSVLHYFQGPPDGANPQTSLFRDAAGNLYGTTVEGGAYGFGTVFKITPANVETVLYSFTNVADGFSPSSVIVDSSGNIYGTAQTNNNFAGLVFKIDGNSNLSVLYNFCSLPACADGQLPSGGVTRDKAGNLYGTTAFGGEFPLGGTLFKVTTAGVETVLHSFGATGDGLDPSYNLIHDLNGNLYGVTVLGGANDPLDEAGGTVFKVNEADGTETLLYSFCALPQCKDGFGPIGPVQMDKAGNFYGVTSSSNVSINDQFATVWKLDTTGKETLLHSFSHTAEVVTGIVIDGAGNLYGTTRNGGANNVGAVYKLTLVK